MAPRVRWATAFALSLATVGIPSVGLWSGRSTLVYRDLHRLFIPSAHVLQERLERLQLPEWDPDVACGHPFVGLGQSQAFYPVRWLQLLAGPDRIFDLLAALHPLFAALAAFLLARRLGHAPAGSAVAAVAAGGTPLLLSAFSAPNLEYAACWFPVVLYLAFRVRESGSVPFAVLAGASVGVAALVGALELAFGEGLAWALLALTGPLSWRRRLVLAGVAAALASLVAAPEILPLLAQAPFGERAAGLSLADASLWSLDPRSALAMAVPRRLAGSQEVDFYKSHQSLLESPYLGITVLVLAAWSALRSRGRAVWLVPAVVLLLIALGTWGGLFPALRVLPGFDRMRFPVKFLLVLPPLLGLGAAGAITALGEAGRRAPAVFALLAVAVLASGGTAVFAAAGLLLLAVSLLLPRTVRPLVAAAAVAIDLAGSALLISPLDLFDSARVAQAAKALPAPDARHRLSTRLDEEERMALGQEPGAPDSLVAFFPNFPSSAGVRMAAGYGPNLDRRIVALSREGGPGVQALMGVSHLLSWPRPEAPEGSPGSTRLGPALLQPVERPLPRGSLFGRWEEHPDPLRRLLEPSFDARTTLVLRPGAGPFTPSGFDPLPAELVEQRPEQVELSVNAPAPGLLLLQDTFLPGWSGTLDGREAPLVEADGAFMAVAVPQGRHTVVLRYRSLPLRVGALSWLAALAIVAGAIAALRLRARVYSPPP